MADKTITASTSDPGADLVTYELGRANWRRAWVPDFTTGGRVMLAEADRIDVVILGDGYTERSELEAQLASWLEAFFGVQVYETMRGAFRIRAVFRRSRRRVGASRASYYRVPAKPDGSGLDSAGDWYNGSSPLDQEFRARVEQDMALVGFNPAQYPDDLDVGGSDTVIHNQLASLLSNCVVCMLARTPTDVNASGFTRDVKLSGGRVLNVAFGANTIHEFGHAFAYLEDEYINGRGKQASRSNPTDPSLFTLSNLSFSSRIDEVPWLHLSPWGRVRRQAAGAEPSPVVGWAWRGGEVEIGVWHSEYNCLMNGRHDNYLFTSVEANDPTANADGSYTNENGVSLRSSSRYCLWCQEIVVARILEKTHRLHQDDDPDDFNERGRLYHERWLSTWRQRYFQTFGVDQAIRDREGIYADPRELPMLTSLALLLWRSDLYSVFTAVPTSPQVAIDDDADLELLMANA